MHNSTINTKSSTFPLNISGNLLLWNKITLNKFILTFWNKHCTQRTLNSWEVIVSTWRPLLKSIHIDVKTKNVSWLSELNKSCKTPVWWVWEIQHTCTCTNIQAPDILHLLHLHVWVLADLPKSQYKLKSKKTTWTDSRNSTNLHHKPSCCREKLISHRPLPRIGSTVLLTFLSKQLPNICIKNSI